MKLEPFEKRYTLTQCRKLLDILDDASVTDEDFAEMFYDLQATVSAAEEQTAKRGVRRDVESMQWRWPGWLIRFECGHSVMHDASRHTFNKPPKYGYCKQCKKS